MIRKRIIHLSLLSLALLAFVGSACIVTPAPSVRGWKCASDADCLNQLSCYQGFCRGSCPTGEDLDCNSSLNETCNNDNYCVPPGPNCQNGQTRSCYDGPSGTEGKGICKSGTQTCTNSKWGACTGAVTPKKEADNGCNNSDDDCDGQIDNGVDCQCTPGTKRSCYGDGKAIPGCTKSGESFQCTGICKSGTQLCGSNSQWGACQGWKGPDADEKCNNADDDCDGQVDEDLTDINKTCQVPGKAGPCADGKTQCNNGSPVCRSSHTITTEDCNGKDDDCDGRVDNIAGRSDALRKPCYTVPTGCQPDQGGYKCQGKCKAGFQRCLNPQATWGACENQTLPDAEEKCNNVDDNCNGTIDENATDCPSGKTCTNGSCQ